MKKRQISISNIHTNECVILEDAEENGSMHRHQKPGAFSSG
jgi:hypothetical protein